MTRWRCPGCHAEMQARAVAVGHRCPARHNRVIDWVPVTDDNATPAPARGVS